MNIAQRLLDIAIELVDHAYNLVYAGRLDDARDACQTARKTIELAKSRISK
jgi:hypothetical protein